MNPIDLELWFRQKGIHSTEQFSIQLFDVTHDNFKKKSVKKNYKPVVPLIVNMWLKSQISLLLSPSGN